MNRRLALLTAFLTFFAAGCGNSDQNDTGRGTHKPQFNGNEQGNGTDNVPYEFGTAWIHEPETLKYCAVVGGDFGLSRAQVLQELQKAFQNWRAYFTAKKINDAIETQALEHLNRTVASPTPEERLAAKTFRIAQTTELRPACDGSENVVFYFGVENEATLNAKRNYYNPTAFAFRTHHDEYAGTSKGFVWVVKEGGLGEHKGDYPRWTLPSRLLGVLMHEIGHIYGVGHVENTIMAEEMWSDLLDTDWTTQNQDRIEYRMGRIDHGNELYLAPVDDPSISYEGAMTAWLYPNEPGAIAQIVENFTNVIGRAPVGLVTAEFARMQLSISDAAGAYVFPIAMDMTFGSANNKRVFKVERKWQVTSGQSGMGFSLYMRSSVNTGLIHLTGGRQVPVILKRNFGVSPFALTYLMDGKERALLFSRYY